MPGTEVQNCSFHGSSLAASSRAFSAAANKGARHCFAELWMSWFLARGEIERFSKHKGSRHCFAELWMSWFLARGEIECFGIRGKIRIRRSSVCPPLNPSADAIA